MVATKKYQPGPLVQVRNAVSRPVRQVIRGNKFYTALKGVTALPKDVADEMVANGWVTLVGGEQVASPPKEEPAQEMAADEQAADATEATDKGAGDSAASRRTRQR